MYSDEYRCLHYLSSIVDLVIQHVIGIQHVISNTQLNIGSVITPKGIERAADKAAELMEGGLGCLSIIYQCDVFDLPFQVKEYMHCWKIVCEVVRYRSKQVLVLS